MTKHFVHFCIYVAQYQNWNTASRNLNHFRSFNSKRNLDVVYSQSVVEFWKIDPSVSKNFKMLPFSSIYFIFHIFVPISVCEDGLHYLQKRKVTKTFV